MGQATVNNPRRFDVTRGFRYKVEFEEDSQFADGFDDAADPLPAGFQSVTGIGSEVETVDYREGVDEIAMKKLMGLLSFPVVVFTKGVDPLGVLHKWHAFCHGTGVDGTTQPGREGPADTVAGSTTPSPTREEGRRNLIITVLSRGGDETAGDVPRRFKLRNAWPKTYELGDLDASSSDILTEAMSIEHEGLEILAADEPDFFA